MWHQGSGGPRKGGSTLPPDLDNTARKQGHPAGARGSLPAALQNSSSVSTVPTPSSVPRPSRLFPFSSSHSPHAPALDFYLSVSSLTALLLHLFSLTAPVSLPLPDFSSHPNPIQPLALFSHLPSAPTLPPEQTLPRRAGLRLQGSLWETPPWGSIQGRETKSAPASHLGGSGFEWEH